MSKKYTQEDLIELRTNAVVPTQFDFAQFTQAIEQQRGLQEEEQHHDAFGRRRSSHHLVRPVFKPRKPKAAPPQPDADGWVTLNKKNSVSGEEATQARDKFRESVKETSSQGFIRPNNKNISSSKPADARDIIADKPKTAFNAFAALGSDDDESEEEDDE
jgi:cap-associated protein CAF20